MALDVKNPRAVYYASALAVHAVWGVEFQDVKVPSNEGMTAQWQHDAEAVPSPLPSEK
jgi:hypothetical protein